MQLSEEKLNFAIVW